MASPDLNPAITAQLERSFAAQAKMAEYDARDAEIKAVTNPLVERLTAVHGVLAAVIQQRPDRRYPRGLSDIIPLPEVDRPDGTKAKIGAIVTAYVGYNQHYGWSGYVSSDIEYAAYDCIAEPDSHKILVEPMRVNQFFINYYEITGQDATNAAPPRSSIWRPGARVATPSFVRGNYVAYAKTPAMKDLKQRAYAQDLTKAHELVAEYDPLLTSAEQTAAELHAAVQY